MAKTLLFICALCAALCAVGLAECNVGFIAQDSFGFSGAVTSSRPLPTNATVADVVVDAITVFSASTPASTDNFLGAIVANGFIWALPFITGSVVSMDIASTAPRSYSQYPPGVTIGTTRFCGGAIVGRDLWLVPRFATAVVRMDVETGAMEAFTAFPRDLVPTSEAFCGAVVVDRYVFMGPADANMLLRVDSNSGLIRGFNPFPPGLQRVSVAFVGIVYDGHSALWLVPCNVNMLVRIDIARDMDAPVPAGFGNFPFKIGAQAFVGGTALGDWVYLAPRDAPMLIRVRTVPSADGSQAVGNMDGFNDWPAPLTSATTLKFCGATSDGVSVWLAPNAAPHLLRFIHATSRFVSFDIWPTGFAAGQLKVGGIVFDGAPNPVLRIRLRENIARQRSCEACAKPADVDASDSALLSDGFGSGRVARKPATPLALNSRSASGKYDGIVLTAFARPSSSAYFSSAILAHYLWAPPLTGQELMRVDTRDGSIALINVTWPTGLFTAPGKTRFTGACAVSDTELIFVPAEATTFVKFDTKTGNLTRMPDLPRTLTYISSSGYKFLGATWVSTHRRLFVAPFNAEALLELDPESGSMVAHGKATWPSAVSTRGSYFSGIVRDRIGQLWLVPYAASHVVRVTVHGPGVVSMLAVSLATVPNFTPGDRAFAGAAYDGDRFVYLAPQTASHILRVDVIGGALVGFATWPSGFDGGPNKFCGAASDSLGVWFTPHSANGIVRVDARNGTMTLHHNWPAGFAPSRNGDWCGASFDGKSLWLTPVQSAVILRVSSDPARSCAQCDFPPTQVAGTDGHSESTPVFATPLTSSVSTRLRPLTPGAGSFAGAAHFNGSLWLLPSSARFIATLHIATGAINELREWPSTFTMPAWSAAYPPQFSAAVFVPSINLTGSVSVLLVPLAADAVVKFDALTGTPQNAYRSWPSGFSAGSPTIGKFSAGAVASRDPFVFMAPLGANQLVRIAPHTGNMAGFSVALSGVTNRDAKFCAMAIRDDSIFLVPQQSTHVLQFVMSTDSFRSFRVPVDLVGTTVDASAHKFATGLFDFSREELWLVPYEAQALLRFSIKDSSFRSFPMHQYFPWATGGGANFTGAIFDGVNLWMLGRFSSALATRFDVTSSTASAVALSDSSLVPRAAAFDGQSIFVLPSEEGEPLIEVVNLGAQLACAQEPMCRRATTVLRNDGISASDPIVAAPLDVAAGVTMRSYTNFPADYSINTHVEPVATTGVVLINRTVVFAPYFADAVLLFDIDTKAMRSFRSWPSGLTRTSNVFFTSAVAELTSSNVWFVPGHASRVLRLNIVTFEAAVSRNWPANLQATGLWFFGGLIVGGHIILAPHTATAIVRMRLSDFSVTQWRSWPPGLLVSSAVSKFGGIVSCSPTSNPAILVPTQTNQVVLLDTQTGAMLGYDAWPAGLITPESKFTGGVCAPRTDDIVFLIPSTATMLVKLQISTGAMTGYNAWSPRVAIGDGRQFCGAVSDGGGLFLVPSWTSAVVRFDLDAEAFSTIAAWPPGLSLSNQYNFCSGVFTGDSIIFGPRSVQKAIVVMTTPTTRRSCAAPPSCRQPRQLLVQGGYSTSASNHPIAVTPLGFKNVTMRGVFPAPLPGPAVNNGYAGVLYHLGFVYLVPNRATCLTRVRIGTTAVESFCAVGSCVGGAIFGDDLWMPPTVSTVITRFDTITTNVTLFTNWQVPSQPDKFCTVIATADRLFFVPYHQSWLLEVDPVTLQRTVRNNWASGVTAGNIAFAGAAYATASQDIVLIPYDAAQVVIFNIANKLIRAIPETAWPSPIVGSAPQKFAGGLYVAQLDAVFLAPLRQRAIVRLDLQSSTMRALMAWPYGYAVPASPATLFCGGVFDGDSLWLAPQQAGVVMRVDPFTDDMIAYRNFPAGSTGGVNGFCMGTTDGRSVFLGARDSPQILQIDSDSGDVCSGHPEPHIEETPPCVAALNLPASGDGIAQSGPLTRAVSVGFKNVTMQLVDITWPAAYIPGTYARLGAFTALARVFIVPQSANALLSVHVGDQTSFSFRYDAAFGDEAHSGAAFDGRFVWFAPLTTRSVLRLELLSNERFLYDKWPLTVTLGDAPFIGVCYVDGFVYFAPSAASHIVRVHAAAANESHAHMEAIALDADPTAASINRKYFGAVAAGGYVWFVPYGATALLRLDPVSLLSTAFAAFPTGVLAPPGGFNFAGAVADSTGTLWLIPWDALSIVKVTMSNGLMAAFTTVPPGFNRGANGVFCGGAFDGRSIWLVPSRASMIVRIIPETGEVFGYDNFPVAFGPTAYKGCGATFDGEGGVWWSARNENAVIRITSDDTRGERCPATDTPRLSPTEGASHSPTPSHRQTLSDSRSTSPMVIARDSSTRSARESESATLSPSLSLVEKHTTTAPVNPPASHVPTAAPPTPPPGRVVSISVVLPGGSAGGEAVVSSAGASTAVTSALTSGTAGSAIPRVSGALRVLDCPLSDSEPRPAFYELPIQPTLGGRLGFFAGAALVHAILVSALTAVSLALFKARRFPRTLRILSGAAQATLSYFGPFVLGAVITVLVHDSNEAQNVAAVLLAAALVVGTRFFIDLNVFRAPLSLTAMQYTSAGGTVKQRLVPTSMPPSTSTTPTPSTSPSGSSNQSSFADAPDVTLRRGSASDRAAADAEWFLSMFSVCFDGARDFTRVPVRMYGFVEFSSAAAVTMLAGIRPNEGCENVAWAITAISLAVLAYVAVLRPYRSRLDTFFSIVVNLLQAALAVCALVAVRADDSSAPGVSGAAVDAVQGLMVVLVAVFYAQLVVCVAWLWILMQRRRRRAEREALSDASSLGTAMLVVPPPPTGSEETESNATPMIEAKPMNPLLVD